MDLDNYYVEKMARYLCRLDGNSTDAKWQDYVAQALRSIRQGNREAANEGIGEAECRSKMLEWIERSPHRA